MPVEMPAALRRLVFDRAAGRCEYCLLPQAAVAYQHEPDHIVPRQHDGQTEAGNLALACTRCNRYKGPNVGSFDSDWQIGSSIQPPYASLARSLSTRWSCYPSLDARGPGDCEDSASQQRRSDRRTRTSHRDWTKSLANCRITRFLHAASVTYGCSSPVHL